MNRTTIWSCVAAVALGVVVSQGCRSTRPGDDVEVVRREPMPLAQAMSLIDRREDWTAFPCINVPRHPAEKYLKDVTIVLDPGHGGEDGGDTSTQPKGYKEGPTGAKEAHMNLRVALLLRRLLADAGANVVMTREGDDTIGLRERAEVANNAVRPDGGVGADLFISIHHNAVGNRETNYTSVWYHGSVDHNEVELDVAEPIAHALGREMRTQVAKTSPVLSSQLMYPTGFGVLRACEVPGILLECSFFTNPAEEQRLLDAGYNLRQAYGIYVGLCEWAYGGRPTQEAPIVSRAGDELTIETTLDPGLPAWWGADRPRIVSSTVSVMVDGQRVPFQFDPHTRRLTATMPAPTEQSLEQKRRTAAERRERFRQQQGQRRSTAPDRESDPATAAATAPSTAPARTRRGDESFDVVVEIHHANMFKHHNWPQRYGISLPAGGSPTVEPLGAVRDTYRAPATTTAPSTRPATTMTTTTRSGE